MPPVILTLNPLCYEGVYITYSQAAVMDSVCSLHLKRCKEYFAEKKEEKMVGGLTYIGEPARMVIWNPKDNNYYLPTYCRSPLPS